MKILCVRQSDFKTQYNLNCACYLAQSSQNISLPKWPTVWAPKMDIVQHKPLDIRDFMVMQLLCFV